MADLPARIDRAALDRIIQRAAELQTGERELGDEMTEEQVLALGRDVGIPARYLQQALIEERVRTAPAESRWLDRTIGAATVTADRVVMGSPDLQEQLLLDWMERTEHLVVQRHQGGRITWEQMGGFQAVLRMSAAALERRHPRHARQGGIRGGHDHPARGRLLPRAAERRTPLDAGGVHRRRGGASCRSARRPPPCWRCSPPSRRSSWCRCPWRWRRDTPRRAPTRASRSGPGSGSSGRSTSSSAGATARSRPAAAPSMITSLVQEVRKALKP